MREKIKFENLVLVLLFLFVLGFRLYFAFQSSHFNTDGAYFNLRHIEYFKENFKVLYYDELSYGGRFVFFPPLFHILMALISFGNIFILKFIPELLLALVVFIVYKIAKEISGSSYSAIFAAALYSFIPIFLEETLNNISIYSFLVPLLLLMLYSLLRLDEKKYLWIFIISSFMLPLVHPLSLVYVITVILYFLLISGGALLATKIKKEAVLFSILLIIFFNFIIYKKAFLEFGANVLKENIPANILADSFRQFSPVDLLFGVGILVLVLGGVGIYIALIKERRKVAYIFGAFAVSILLLLVLRLITIPIGVMFLGIALSIFSASSVSSIYNYLSNVKFGYFKNIFVVLLLVLFFIFSVSPSYVAAKKSDTITEEKIRDVEWLAQNTDEDDVILANVQEGNLIAAIANRKTVADTNFLFANKPLERVEDMKIAFSTLSEALALNVLNKYNIDVIYLSDDSRREYNIVELSYAEKSFEFEESAAKGSRCFEVKRRGTFYVVEC